jgi:hypothetical protein
MLHEFWHNVAHNLFKPFLLFFYLGLLIPILKVRFEFPRAVSQGLTMYLLLAIGWQGGEEFATINAANIGAIAGFMAVGFALNFVIGAFTYFVLTWTSGMRRIDQAMIAGCYGSDSAGTFAICVAILTGLGIAFNAYMPVMLAVMEIPGCLLAVYLAARLRNRGMDATGNMPGELGYIPPATQRVGPGTATQPICGQSLDSDQELTISVKEPGCPGPWQQYQLVVKQHVPKVPLIKDVLLSPGLCLLVGSIVVGFISGLQGHNVAHDDDIFFVSAFQGALCLFLLEMGMRASRKLKDVQSAGIGFIFFGLLAPNFFALLGIVVAHGYAFLTNTAFRPGTYVLFAVLCGAASYIVVPAIQQLAVPEASPTLPLAVSLGLTFTYNVTIGIPLYLELDHLATWYGL